MISSAFWLRLSAPECEPCVLCGNRDPSFLICLVHLIDLVDLTSESFVAVVLQQKAQKGRRARRCLFFVAQTAVRLRRQLRRSVSSPSGPPPSTVPGVVCLICAPAFIADRRLLASTQFVPAPSCLHSLPSAAQSPPDPVHVLCSGHAQRTRRTWPTRTSRSTSTASRSRSCVPCSTSQSRCFVSGFRCPLLLLPCASCSLEAASSACFPAQRASSCRRLRAVSLLATVLGFAEFLGIIAPCLRLHGLCGFRSPVERIMQLENTIQEQERTISALKNEVTLQKVGLCASVRVDCQFRSWGRCVVWVV